MKFIFILLFSLTAFAQSPEDQIRQLQAENQALKAENAKLKAELNQAKAPSTADTARMMEVLQKGKKYQEDQLKALEELEKEE